MSRAQDSHPQPPAFIRVQKADTETRPSPDGRVDFGSQSDGPGVAGAK
jgi:hypothetical protein